jgi:GNAT superfamily N-acetyltransferase
MRDDLDLALVDSPDREDLEFIGQQLSRFNEDQGGQDEFRRVFISLREKSGALVGGLYGTTYWGWLHIEVLFVIEEYRRRGLGGRLLEMAELEGAVRGARRAFLDTFSFQAIDFYCRRGYQVFGELLDFPPGHRRCWLVKSIGNNQA